MRPNTEQPQRRSIRLKGYDYSQTGAYFITICAQDGLCLLGEVVDGVMELNDAGRMILEIWNGLPERFPAIELDSIVVMPNHIHFIVLISREAERPTLGDIVGALKSLTTVEYGRQVRRSGWRSFGRHLWQRNYYERVVRNENELFRLRAYIEENPLRWDLDLENPRGTRDIDGPSRDG